MGYTSFSNGSRPSGRHPRGAKELPNAADMGMPEGNESGK